MHLAKSEQLDFLKHFSASFLCFFALSESPFMRLSHRLVHLSTSENQGDGQSQTDRRVGQRVTVTVTISVGKSDQQARGAAA